MNPNTLISDKELREPVQSNTALEWVESLMSRFYNTKENQDFITLKNGVTQELLDELLPLGKYAKSHYNSPEILLKFYPGCSTSYDADFIGRQGNLVERVEVTMAVDGQQSRIQAEAMNQYGYSRVYHTPEYSGTVKNKNRKIKEPEGSIIGTDYIIELQVNRIQEAYRKKNKNLDKYPDTTLLIGVDIPLLMDWEYQSIIERFEVSQSTFRSIKCVNISSNHYWCLK
jgi:hypothetical protein